MSSQYVYTTHSCLASKQRFDDHMLGPICNRQTSLQSMLEPVWSPEKHHQDQKLLPRRHIPQNVRGEIRMKVRVANSQVCR